MRSRYFENKAPTQSVAELERWHDLYERGIDPDHSCVRNARVVGSTPGYTAWQDCRICGSSGTR